MYVTHSLCRRQARSPVVVEVLKFVRVGVFVLFLFLFPFRSSWKHGSLWFIFSFHRNGHFLSSVGVRKLCLLHILSWVALRMSQTGGHDSTRIQMLAIRFKLQRTDINFVTSIVWFILLKKVPVLRERWPFAFFVCLPRRSCRQNHLFPLGRKDGFARAAHGDALSFTAWPFFRLSFCLLSVGSASNVPSKYGGLRELHELCFHFYHHYQGYGTLCPW